jgi:hypothetical protein
MEPLLETIDLDIEESNELLFKVKVEGVEQAPAKVRLVCEVGELGYMFDGHATSEEGVVQFLLPVMKDKVKAGTYLSRVEVLIENRYFAPVQFNLNLKQAVKVVAESIQAPQRKVVPQVKVTATSISSRTTPVPPPPRPIARPLVVEEPAKRPATLKERFANKRNEASQGDQVIEEVTESSEDLIRELAQTFVKTKKK